jgi:hypothetical protein
MKPRFMSISSINLAHASGRAPALPNGSRNDCNAVNHLLFNFDPCPPAGEARPPVTFIVGFFNNQMTCVFRGDHETTIGRKAVKKQGGRLRMT